MPVNPVSGKLTPVELADSIHSFCTGALETMNAVDASGNTDLLYEVSDIKAWAYLGLYFSNKLKAAVEYQHYVETGQTGNHVNAVQFLETAVDNWRHLVQVTEPVYQPVPLMHYTHSGGNKYFHWADVEGEVTEELNWLKRLNID
jgi:hypothetical protein